MAKLPDLSNLGTANAEDIQINAPVHTHPAYEDPQGNAEIGLGRDLGSVSDDLYKVYAKQKAQLDDTAVADAVNQATQLAIQLKYDKTNGALNNLGADAVKPDFVSGYQTQLDNGIQNIAQNLSPDQQAKFRVHSDALSTDFNSNLMQWSGRQADVWHVATDKASLQTLTQAGAIEAASPTPNPKNIQSNLDSIDATLTSALSRAGQATFDDNQNPTGVLKSAIQQAHGEYYKALIQSALGSSQNPGDQQENTARALFLLHKNELDPKDQEVIGTRLEGIGKENKIRADGQTFASKAMSQNLTEAETYAWARDPNNVPLGDVQAQTISNLDKMFTEQGKAQQQSNDVIKNYALSQASQGLPVSSDVLNEMKTNPDLGEVYTQYNQAQKNYQIQQQALAKGVDIKTDPVAYYTLTNTAAQDPGTFKNLNLLATPEWGQLSLSDQKSIANLQREVAAKTHAQLKMMTTSHEQIASSLVQTGINNKKDMTIAQGKIGEAIDAEAIARGRQLTTPERQQVIDNQLIHGQILGSWYNNTSQYRYQVTGTPNETSFTPDNGGVVVPQSDRLKIIGALQRQGRPVTEDAINQLYQLKQNGPKLSEQVPR